MMFRQLRMLLFLLIVTCKAIDITKDNNAIGVDSTIAIKQNSNSNSPKQIEAQPDEITEKDDASNLMLTRESEKNSKKIISKKVRKYMSPKLTLHQNSLSASEPQQNYTLQDKMDTACCHKNGIPLSDTQEQSGKESTNGVSVTESTGQEGSGDENESTGQEGSGDENENESGTKTGIPNDINASISLSPSNVLELSTSQLPTPSNSLMTSDQLYSSESLVPTTSSGIYTTPSFLPTSSFQNTNDVSSSPISTSTQTTTDDNLSTSPSISPSSSSYLEQLSPSQQPITSSSSSYSSEQQTLSSSSVFVSPTLTPGVSPTFTPSATSSVRRILKGSCSQAILSQSFIDNISCDDIFEASIMNSQTVYQDCRDRVVDSFISLIIQRENLANCVQSLNYEPILTDLKKSCSLVSALLSNINFPISIKFTSKELNTFSSLYLNDQYQNIQDFGLQKCILNVTNQLINLSIDGFVNSDLESVVSFFDKVIPYVTSTYARTLIELIKTNSPTNTTVFSHIQTKDSISSLKIISEQISELINILQVDNNNDNNKTSSSTCGISEICSDLDFISLVSHQIQENIYDIVYKNNIRVLSNGEAIRSAGLPIFSQMETNSNGLNLGISSAIYYSRVDVGTVASEFTFISTTLANTVVTVTIPKSVLIQNSLIISVFVTSFDKSNISSGCIPSAVVSVNASYIDDNLQLIPTPLPETAQIVVVFDVDQGTDVSCAKSSSDNLNWIFSSFPTLLSSQSTFKITQQLSCSLTASSRIAILSSSCFSNSNNITNTTTEKSIDISRTKDQKANTIVTSTEDVKTKPSEYWPMAAAAGFTVLLMSVFFVIAMIGLSFKTNETAQK